MSMSEIHQNQWLMEMVQTPGQVPPARPNQAQEQPAAAAPVPIILRPNVTINLNADRILRGIFRRGHMMRGFHGQVPKQEQLGAEIPKVSEDEDQAWLPTWNNNLLHNCVILPRTSEAVLPWRGSNVTQPV